MKINYCFSRSIQLAGAILAALGALQTSLAKGPPSLLEQAFPGVVFRPPASGPGDYVPLGLVSARTWGNPSAVEVVFTAPVDPATATRATNYVVAPGVTVLQAAPGTNAWTVVLKTAPAMPDAAVHTLTVANVRDLANPTNVIAAGSTVPILKAQGVITRRVYTGIGGNWLNSLTNAAKFPNSPDFTEWPSAFETPQNYGDFYGEQVAGYLCPPVTGDYQFFLASDNEGVLYLSTDTQPANNLAIAYVPSVTGFRQWTAGAGQVSGYVRLVAGQSYYIEALMAESTGNDYLSVTWRMRGMPAPADGDAPIPGGFLSSLSASGPAAVAVPPQDASVAERQPAGFSVSAAGTPPYTYQWLKNGVPVPGATASGFQIPSASYADHNAQFSVAVANSFSSATSGVARLTVLADTTPPGVARLGGGPTLDRVLVGFSEPVNPTSAADPRNYGIDGGLTVLGAEPLPDQTNVVLTTTRQTPGRLYTVNVAGVTDLAAAKNPANATASFNAWTLGRGFVRREAFYGLPGSLVANLLTAANFPDNPDSADYPTAAEAPQNIGRECGERLAGLLLPPVTGYYVFYFYSADQGALYLSPDESPANKALIATEPQWNYYRTWVSTDRRNPAAPENRSAPVYLEAGKRYYFEALMKDSDGDNRVGVAWQLPGGPAPANGDGPISSPYLASYANATGSTLAITQQPPAAVSAPESSFTNLTVGVNSSFAGVFYQWQKNGNDIPGANASAFTTPRLLRGDSGSAYRCVVSIPGLTLTSAVATVTVPADNLAPQAVSAATLMGSTNIGVAFSELMDAASATNPANYGVNIAGSVVSAVLRPDGQSVSLGITGLPFTNCAVTLNNLKDYAGNALPAGTVVPVRAIKLEHTDIGVPGDPVEPGSTFSSKEGDYDVVAGGSDIWNTRDGFHYVYRPHEGDFDMRVRVARLDWKSTYTFAGLLARENLSPGSRNVRVHLFTTNGANGFHASTRAQQDGGTGAPGVTPGPVPYPNAWLRLTRTNDTFTGWHGTNGVNWTPYYTATLSLTGRIYVGMAACPVNNGVGQATTAWFRDFSLAPDYALPGPIDLLVKKASDGAGAFALNDVYQAVPAGAQTLTQGANPSTTASFTVKLENDGALGQGAVVRAVESGGSDWSVAYQLGGSNITAQVTNTSGFGLPGLAAGAAEFLLVDIRPGPRTAGGATKSVSIKTTTDPYTRSQRDAVRLVAINERNYQPDLSVRRADDVVYAGLGIYNNDGANQTKSATADAGIPLVFALQAVNAGNLTNAFNVTAGAAGDGWTVRYFDALAGGTDITAEITGSGVGISLLPGAAWEFRAELTAGAGVVPGGVKTLAVTAVSLANPARSDTVKISGAAQVLTTVPQPGIFTSDNDFERGRRVGTEYGGGQLTLSSNSVTWPYLWVPNSNEGTVSKVDVRTGRELGRYRTCPPGVNGQPSRTTIDQYGNCWVANRQSGTMVKIGLAENGYFLDRNTNGVAETSSDLNNDGDITGAELLGWGQDECVLHEVIAIPGQEGTFTPGTFAGTYANNYWNPGPRGIAVDYWGNVWLGTHDAMKYYYVDGETARILRTNDLAPLQHTPYGAVVDGNGLLWSSGYRDPGTSTILRLDPTDNSMTTIVPGFHTYGLGVDRNHHLFVSAHQEAKLARIDTLTGTIEWTVNAGYQSRGIAVTDDGDVWVACSYEGNVWRFSNDGVFKGKIAVGTTPTGVSVDSAGKVWVVNDGDEYIKRIDPDVGAVGAVGLSKRIVGGLHYGYSDMTGIIARSTTGRFGTWTVTHDAVVPFTQWGVVTWNGYEPAGNNIVVRVRSSDDGRVWGRWETATNGVALGGTAPGRFLQVEVSLRTTAGGIAPVLYDLTVQPLARRTADLAVSQSVTPSLATNEHLVTWTITATNRGPQDARGVYVLDTLPAFVNLLSATGSYGTVTSVAGGLRAVLGELKTGSNFTLVVTAMVTAPGTLTNSVLLGNYEVDPAPGNNVSTLLTPAVENPCVPPLPGMRSWWTGDGTPGDLAGTNHGVLAGGATYAPGKSGLAFQFNGNGAYVELGPVSPGTQWSLEAWVNFSATLSGRRLILGSEAQCRDWGLVANNGELGVNIGKNGCVAIYGSGVTAVNGVWYHLVGTCDGTNAAIYVNGQLKNSGPVDLNYLGTSAGMRIGSAVCCGEFIAALVDEPALYSRALTAAEVFALFDAGASGKCKAAFAPTVQLVAADGGLLNVSWPASASGFKLQTTTALGTPWELWTNPPPTVSGDRLIFPVSPTNSARFFRLVKP